VRGCDKAPIGDKAEESYDGTLPFLYYCTELHSYSKLVVEAQLSYVWRFGSRSYITTKLAVL
jgi:hypothetical protein